MITPITLSIYRTSATVIACLPIVLISYLNATIFTVMLAIPLLSLVMAGLGKYLDVHLVKVMLKQQDLRQDNKKTITFGPMMTKNAIAQAA